MARLELEDGVAEWQHVGERSARLRPFVEHEDAAVVDAELELPLGEDHPVRDLAAQLRLLELLAVGQDGAGDRDGDGRAGAEVPRAADDLSRFLVADVDAAEMESVGVRMLAGFDDLADEVVAEIPVRVGDAPLHDPVDLAARDDESRGDLLDRLVESDVLLQPADGDTHGH